MQENGENALSKQHPIHPKGLPHLIIEKISNEKKTLDDLAEEFKDFKSQYGKDIKTPIRTILRGRLSQLVQKGKLVKSELGVYSLPTIGKNTPP